MDGQMEFGTVFTSDNGYRYKVFRLLGAGGQGEVYDVQKEGEGHYALKWYFPHMATGEQKSILENLLKQGAPSRSFLWPLDLIVDPASHTFGYIMEIRPKNYKSIVDMMKRRAEPSYDALCRAAWNLISGYRTLHSRGYCYRDISFGNVFLDPDDGSILICDNDNVSANGTSGATVYGTPRFMAPEIVTGQAKPSRNTDLYSLAVLLFYMFMMGHPLDGKREAEIRCLDIHAMNQLYGFSPLFVFDPKDHSNRPVAGYQDNVLASWGVYPETLRELFTRAFTDGLKQPNKRITENQWTRWPI